MSLIVREFVLPLTFSAGKKPGNLALVLTLSLAEVSFSERERELLRNRPITDV
jgi:hypothetical protein